MLAKRIIPTILMKNGLMVKGKRFSADRVVGNALQAARIYAMRGVDELMMLDVTATFDNRMPNYRLIEQLTKYAQIPVTIGGGVSSDGITNDLFLAGADKVCVGFCEPAISMIAERFGSQAVVASVDADAANTGYLDAARNSAEWKVQNGAGEILLQAVHREGTMDGYDLELINTVCDAVTVPVIASGGCKDYADMKAAIDAGASAVAAGALFQFESATPRGAAKYLHEQGVEVRL